MTDSERNWNWEDWAGFIIWVVVISACAVGLWVGYDRGLWEAVLLGLGGEDSLGLISEDSGDISGGEAGLAGLLGLGIICLFVISLDRLVSFMRAQLDRSARGSIIFYVVVTAAAALWLWVGEPGRLLGLVLVVLLTLCGGRGLLIFIRVRRMPAAVWEEEVECSECGEEYWLRGRREEYLLRGFVMQGELECSLDCCPHCGAEVEVPHRRWATGGR